MFVMGLTIYLPIKFTSLLYNQGKGIIQGIYTRERGYVGVSLEFGDIMLIGKVHLYFIEKMLMCEILIIPLSSWREAANVKVIITITKVYPISLSLV